MDWGGVNRSSCFKFLVRVGFLGTVFIEIPCGFPSVGWRCPGAESSHIPAKDIKFGLACNDPIRNDFADTRALIKSRHHPVRTKIVFKIRMGADQRPQIGRENHGTVDDPFDTGFSKARHDFDRFLKVPLHAGQVIRQQFVSEVQGRGVLGPMRAGLFVRAKQQTLTFLTRIAACLVVVNLRQFEIQLLDLVYVLRYQVVMFHRNQRQLHARQSANLPAPESGRVDDEFGLYLAFLGADLPQSAWQLNRPGNRVVAVDGNTPLSCCRGKCLGG